MAGIYGLFVTCRGPYPLFLLWQFKFRRFGMSCGIDGSDGASISGEVAGLRMLFSEDDA